MLEPVGIHVGKPPFRKYCPIYFNDLFSRGYEKRCKPAFIRLVWVSLVISSQPHYTNSAARTTTKLPQR